MGTLKPYFLHFQAAGMLKFQGWSLTLTPLHLRPMSHLVEFPLPYFLASGEGPNKYNKVTTYNIWHA